MGYKGMYRKPYLELAEAAAENQTMTDDDKAFVGIHLKAARMGLKSNDRSQPDYIIREDNFDRLVQLAADGSQAKIAPVESEADDQAADPGSQDSDQDNEPTVVSEGDIDANVLADAVQDAPAAEVVAEADPAEDKTPKRSLKKRKAKKADEPKPAAE